MSFDFPASPTENQEYTPAGGPTYIFKSPRWMVKGVPAGISDAPNDGKPYVRKAAAWDDFTDDMALKEATANKGAANGYAPLDASTKIAAIYLPAYVDDVVEYANFAAFPATGTAGLIYVALDTNRVYRWSGSAYVEISPSPGSSDAVPEGSVNLYYTAARSALKADLASPTFTGDPKAPTPSTADNDTSIATTAHVQANMALKANATHTHPQSDIVNLTTDLALKAPLASPTFTGVPAAPTATAGTNTTQLATTAFVTAAAALKENVIAPGTAAQYWRGDKTWAAHDFNTLSGTINNTQHGSLGGGALHPAATTSVNGFMSSTDKTKLDAFNAASTYAPLADPAFTGNPTAPTPTVNDSDTSIATTAFVQTAVAVAKVTLSDTAPGSPVVGQLWYETDTGGLLIYYNDGNSTQWVQIAGAVV